jgi:hypothetical protein
VVNVLSSKIKLLSLIFEEVVDRIFECEKISIVAYIDTVHQVSTSCSRSLTDLFCGTKRHEAMCDGTYIVLYNIYLTLYLLTWDCCKTICIICLDYIASKTISILLSGVNKNVREYRGNQSWIENQDTVVTLDTHDTRRRQAKQENIAQHIKLKWRIIQQKGYI